MEIKVKQIVKDEEKDKIKGGWHTENSLQQMGWDKPLTQSSILSL
jgi:hypothetical protein